jgi:extracellular factor (EF) 3-hydroxypalmitic acid methyl ester biosynthesis protein
MFGRSRGIKYMPSWAEGKEYLAWLAGRGGPEPAEYGMLKKLFDAVHAKEFKIVDGTSVPPSEASSLDPVLDQHRAVFRSTASMQGFSYVKPYGYAGDFEIIERICKSAVSSISNITRWDKFFHEGDAPRAVRNRSSLLATLIREARPESILSAGSGPSLDLAEVLKTDESLKEIEILDNDPNAVARSKVNIAAVEHYLCRSFSFNVRNVLRFTPTRTYGFVWCSGLFDYLNDKTAVFLLKRFNEMLEPGGTLAFGNFGQENGSRSYMEIVGRWFLIYRSPMDLMRLAATSGFLPRKTRVCTDATGLNNFLITTKAT